jgi:hypothetical protein
LRSFVPIASDRADSKHIALGQRVSAIASPRIRTSLLDRDTGAQVASEAKVLRPGLKVLFTTGYARNAIIHHGRLDPGVHLLTKPFTFADLAAKVRDILDGS